MDGSRAGRDAPADWRAAGTDGVDPLRFHRIDALQRRADGLVGEARRAVDAKLAALVEEYTRGLAQAEGARRDDPLGAPVRGALGELADLLDRGTPAVARPGTADDASQAAAADADAAATNDDGAHHADRSMHRDLDAVQDFRRIWSDVRLRSQLRQSLQPAPAGAGPLNSASLVHRALGLMQATSPGYLRHFMAYVDALSCLEQLGAGTVEAETAMATTRRGARTRARKRRS
ncbi:DUF2894 domain-containing protein [Luteimonas marina]|uniref:DUF2894 domain-containing protein n=1 Tax=Luteimonas marina TaxID=488485 RepID=A0A5C5TV90_9GAMM|nr:DUF2894 domain-containing protein [Luteimonas marina]TWT18143.1 DUF2894 domain-containing protein [Luteimonas marina]